MLFTTKLYLILSSNSVNSNILFLHSGLLFLMLLLVMYLYIIYVFCNILCIFIVHLLTVSYNMHFANFTRIGEVKFCEH